MNRRFTFAKNTVCNPPKVTKTNFSGGDKLNYFVSISNFCSFKSPFATNTGLSELDIRRCKSALLVEMKDVIS